jgi:formiminoglutamase
MAPDAAEIERRKRLHFVPYHAALASELARLREQYAHVVLYDCHSIRSLIPRLFAGELPVFNIGTNRSKSCDAQLEADVARLTAQSRWPSVVNGRFTGGWITRHYGRPVDGIHAVQMELAFRGYLSDEARPRWDADFARPIQSVLKRVLEACLAFAER